MILFALLLALCAFALSVWCYLLIRAAHRTIDRAERTLTRSQRQAEDLRTARQPGQPLPDRELPRRGLEPVSP